MNWIEDRWTDLTNLGAGAWLAIALWAAVLLGVVALVLTFRQLRRNRELQLEEIRPHVAMFMESNASDWQLIELVVRNFGKTAAHDVQFAFTNPPTVGRYESEHDGMVSVAELALPSTIPVIAPGQEWRTVWDSAISRAQLGGSIEWRFTGTVRYFDAPAKGKRRREFSRTSCWTGTTCSPCEKQKLELLRALLTYFHYASQETRAEVYQTEIDGIRRATETVKERLQKRQLEDPTDVRMRPLSAGRHHENA
ncbi:MAG: hypothetical protein ACM4D3_00405 [Candidatus Sericytochromatia bacterium]